MLRCLAIAAGAVSVMLCVSSARAGYGAIAYDQASGKLGASFDQASPAAANEQALRQCASERCRAHPVEPKGCGALALSDQGKAWGGADRETLDDAKRDAVQHCQSHAQTGTCSVRVSGCNN